LDFTVQSRFLWFTKPSSKRNVFFRPQWLQAIWVKEEEEEKWHFLSVHFRSCPVPHQLPFFSSGQDIYFFLWLFKKKEKLMPEGDIDEKFKFNFSTYLPTQVSYIYLSADYYFNNGIAIHNKS